MQELGDWLEQLGPAFGVLFLVLVAATGIVLVTISTARLLRRDRRRRGHA